MNAEAKLPSSEDVELHSEAEFSESNLSDLSVLALEIRALAFAAARPRLQCPNSSQAG